MHGDNAHTAVADLHATLSLFPAIETRLAVAQRIGGRRWMLVLNNGVKVHLPAEQDAAAIQRLAALQAGTGLLDRDVAEIDLRGAGVDGSAPVIAGRDLKAPRAASLPQSHRNWREHANDQADQTRAGAP